MTEQRPPILGDDEFPDVEWPPSRDDVDPDTKDEPDDDVRDDVGDDVDSEGGEAS